MTRTVIDQMGQTVLLPQNPKRIISLVPSQTELFFDLGLDDEVVGVTRFCIHPEDKVSTRERIGGTKDFNFEKIKELKPDLIIGNKEENYQDGINELKKDFPVWMSDIYILNNAYQMIASIAEITSKHSEAEQLISEIKTSFNTLPPVTRHLPPLTCSYFIWRKPYMVAASGTFLDHMLNVFGVRNAFADMSRYPTVTAEQIAAANPDLIFLSSEPYSFTEKHIEEFKSISPTSKIMIVDGELFSWYGSRLRYTAKYFERLRKSLF